MMKTNDTGYMPTEGASVEERLAIIDGCKETLKRQTKEYRQGVKRVLRAGAAYDKTKSRAEEKSSAKNLARLSRAEAELSAEVDEMNALGNSARKTLAEIERTYGAISDSYLSVRKKGKARKYSKMSDKLVGGAEERLDDIAADALPYAFAGKEGERRAQGGEPPRRPAAQGAPYGQGAPYYAQSRQSGQGAPWQMPYGAQPFYFVPAYVDPTMGGAPRRPEPPREELEAIIRESVDSAVKEALAPLIESLEEKISAIAVVAPREVCEHTEECVVEEPRAEAVAPVGAPTAEGVPEAGVTSEAESTEQAASQVGEIIKRLEALVGEAEAVSERIKSVTDAQRAVVELQRTFLRDMQGVQVKQRLVNGEQAELAEAQEVVLQHQRLIAEKQAELGEAQKAATVGIAAIMSAQAEVDTQIKSSLQSQKSIIQSNAKNAELQRELAQKQADAARAVKEALAAQKSAARAGKPRRKAEAAAAEQNPTEQREGAE